MNNGKFHVDGIGGDSDIAMAFVLCSALYIRMIWRG